MCMGMWCGRYWRRTDANPSYLTDCQSVLLPSLRANANPQQSADCADDASHHDGGRPTKFLRDQWREQWSKHPDPVPTGVEHCTRQPTAAFLQNWSSGPKDSFAHSERSERQRKPKDDRVWVGDGDSGQTEDRTQAHPAER